MQASGMNAHLSKDIIDKASGAVVDRRTHRIVLIIDGIEHSFREKDLESFEKSLDFLKKIGAPIHEEQIIFRSFWLAAAAGTFLIIASWISQ